MSEEMMVSLQITIVGMGLVFGALILLWWLMELLVRLARDRAPQEEEGSGAVEVETSIKPDSSIETERRKRAALVAIALALSESERSGGEFPIPPTAIVSAWQAVNRSNMLNRRGLRS